MKKIVLAAATVATLSGNALAQTTDYGYSATADERQNVLPHQHIPDASGATQRGENKPTASGGQPGGSADSNGGP